MSDTIEVKLPVSGSSVTIRNYTTRDDDERAENILYAGVSAKQKKGGQEIDFPLVNVMASARSYIPRLVQEIDGDSTNLANKLKELRSEDYALIEKTVEKVVEEHSPKDQAAVAA